MLQLIQTMHVPFTVLTTMNVATTKNALYWFVGRLRKSRFISRYQIEMSFKLFDNLKFNVFECKPF